MVYHDSQQPLDDETVTNNKNKMEKFCILVALDCPGAFQVSGPGITGMIGMD